VLPGSHLIPVLLSRRKPLLLPFLAFVTLVVSAILATKIASVKQDSGLRDSEGRSSGNGRDARVHAEGGLVWNWPTAALKSIMCKIAVRNILVVAASIR
jgi:hypothetical protein